MSHIQALTQALVQLLDDFYDEQVNLISQKILVRADSAASSHEF